MQIILHWLGFDHLCLISRSFGATIIFLFVLAGLSKKTAEYSNTVTLWNAQQQTNGNDIFKDNGFHNKLFTLQKYNFKNQIPVIIRATSGTLYSFKEHKLCRNLGIQVPDSFGPTSD